MKTNIDLVRNRNLICLALCVCVFCIASPVKLKGQTGSAPSVNAPEKTANQDMTIRVAVDEVRIDAVVLNWSGNQITDLKADDFEIYQDGKQQKIVSCTYVNDYIPQDDQEIPLISTPSPSRDDIRRTILFLVLDYGMSFTELHRARLGLKNFVEKQMQPGDLVGILRTSMGYGQQFSSDKRQLLAAIEKIQWGSSQAAVDCGPGG